MKKIKPLFKLSNSKWHAHSWILEYFPPEYEKMCYVEPYFGDGSIIFNKNPSEFEAVNEEDVAVSEILRCLRDESKYFLERLRRIKYCENTFNRMVKKENSEPIDVAICELVLRRMSRSGQKTNFIDSDAGAETWREGLDDLVSTAIRLNKLYIFNKPALEVIKAFDEENTLMFVNPPHLTDDLKSTEMHAELAVALCNFKGKVILSAKPIAFYKKLYSGTNIKGEPLWKCVKKKIGDINECLFLNFQGTPGTPPGGPCKPNL